MKTSTTLLVLFAVALAGCAAPTPEPTPTPSAVDLTVPFEWSYHATGCTEANILLFVDKATLQAQLPEGFIAADAQKVASTGLPTIPGNPRGLILANAFTCETNDATSEVMTEAQVAILVDPPQVEGVTTPAAYDFYETGRITPNAALFAALDGVGWNVLPGNITVTAGTDASTAFVEQAGAEATSFETTTPGSVEFTGIGRFWQAVPTGLAYVDYDIPSVTQTAGSIACTIAAGSLLAETAGGTECGAQNAAGAGFIGFEPTVTLRYLPDASAG